MVTLDPPSAETTTPPTTAAMIPEIGGASLAIAKPNPKGRAIKETTKPEKIFLGSALINIFVWLVFGDNVYLLIINRSVGKSAKICSRSCGNIRESNPTFVGAFMTNKSARTTSA